MAKLNGETFPTVLEAWEALRKGPGYADVFFTMMSNQGINISITLLKPNKSARCINWVPILSFQNDRFFHNWKPGFRGCHFHQAEDVETPAAKNHWGVNAFGGYCKGVGILVFNFESSWVCFLCGPFWLPAFLHSSALFSLALDISHGKNMIRVHALRNPKMTLFWETKLVMEKRPLLTEFQFWIALISTPLIRRGGEGTQAAPIQTSNMGQTWQV